MNKAAQTILTWGLVIVLAGLFLLLFPHVTASLLGMAAPVDGWARLTGAFMVWLGIYYVVAAQSNARAFFRMTVILRPTVLLVLIVFVAMGLFKPPIILVGIADTLAAIWTAWALRAEQQALERIRSVWDEEQPSILPGE
ncbi:MAG: hypothetical protein KC496_01830 [Anaerolineae bacterium]|nr:hypothetical protein [Anaerolineae bacterium]